MTFHVSWKPRGERQIGQIWATALPELRSAIVASLVEIAEALTLRPNDVGESRAGTQRIAFFGPLVITYDVDVDRRRVRIAGVKLLKSADGSK